MRIEPEWLGSFNFVIALCAFAVSIYALARSSRTRQADSFAKLYDECNSHTFGAAMECISNWVVSIPTNQHSTALPGEAEVRIAYRSYLDVMVRQGSNTKNDELEGARRMVKAWFIKCLLIHESGDLTRGQLLALIPTGRVQIMRNAFHMTREQADVSRKLPHNPESRTSTDETYFERLEKILNRRPVRALLRLSQ